LHAVQMGTKTLKFLDKEYHVCCPFSGSVSVQGGKGEGDVPQAHPTACYLD
jgi:hypothetical protein